jgi:hypothetical protein
MARRRIAWEVLMKSLGAPATRGWGRHQSFPRCSGSDSSLAVQDPAEALKRAAISALDSGVQTGLEIKPWADATPI